MAADSEGIEWVSELPPDPRRPTKHGEIAAALRGRPGEWALVARSVSPGSASGWKKSAAYSPPGDFEIVSRKGAEGLSDKRDVYIRFIGGA